LEVTEQELTMSRPSEPRAKTKSLFSEKDTDFAAGTKSLELLYDYTKFHIGIYLTMASAFMTAVALKQGGKDGDLLLPVCVPMALTAVVFIAIAGFAGGVIVSSITQSNERGSAAFLQSKIGPWHSEKTWLRYKALSWTEFEHTAFWIGLGFAALAFLLGEGSVV
jgi:hypothetical protein